jgi:hypothetical protein
MVYKYTDMAGDQLSILKANAGIHVMVGIEACSIPDDEIPNLVSALQNYMSRRAKVLAGNARPLPYGYH